MRIRSTTSILIWILLAGSLTAQDPHHPSACDVQELLSQYHCLCSNVVLRIQNSCTETNVLDVFPMYLSGWLHSAEAIPEILSRMEFPGANEPGTRKIAKRSPGGYVNPIVMVSAGISPTPPTPAAGALPFLPISFSMMTNLLFYAEEGSFRAEVIAWSTSVRFHNEFQSLVNSGASLGQQPWTWIRHLQLDEWEPEPSVPIDSYRQYFSDEDVFIYTNVFTSLRTTADFALQTAMTNLFQTTKAALQEIGHPYEEDPSLWPH